MYLINKKCIPCTKDTPALSEQEASKLLAQVDGWKFHDNKMEIYRDLQFKNYYETIAFVNALASISHKENHHPDLEVHYNRCIVRYKTHIVNGLTENDFICAAKINTLLK